MERVGGRWLSTALDSVALAAAVLAAGCLAIAITRDYTAIAAVWPVNAIVLAAILRRSISRWPALLAGSYIANVIANLLMGNGWIIAVFCSIANLVEVLVCAQFLLPVRNEIGGGKFFSRLFIGAGSGAACSAIIATTAMSVESAVPPWTILSFWFVADGLGLVIFSPALMVLLGRNARNVWMGSHTPTCAALIWTTFVAGVILVFAQDSVDLLPAALLLLLPLAFTLEPPAVVVGFGILSAVAVAATAIGIGPVVEARSGTPTFDLHYLQSILALIGLVGTPASAAIAERQLLLKEVARSHGEAIAANEALGEAVKRAQWAAQARAEFMANVSHELRTPLNSVVGYSRLLISSGTLTGRDRRFARLVQTASEATLAIINDVLDEAALHRGAVVLRQAPFSFRDMLTETGAMIAPLAEAKGLSVETLIDPGIVRLLGDRDRLRQIALNLASNAIKFTASGAVFLMVALEADEDDAQRVRMEVRDTGAGIAREDRQRIFERFTQAAQADGGGSGLGLAIVRGLADAMGGVITLDSEVNVGTTVAVTLTLAKAANAAGEHRSAIAALSPQRVLVVDDVDLNRDLAALILSQRGHTVETAKDALEAIERCKSERFDFIFMDIRMPGMDGLEATRAIRAAGASRRTPIIALTAGVRSEQVAACFGAGMDGCVGKPFSESELLRAMARCAATPVASAPGPVALEPLRERFIERLNEDRRVLVAGATQSNFAAIVHRMAGSAGSLGFDAIGARAAVLDELLERGAGDVDHAVLQLLQAIDAEINQAAA